MAGLAKKKEKKMSIWSNGRGRRLLCVRARRQHKITKALSGTHAPKTLLSVP